MARGARAQCAAGRRAARASGARAAQKCAQCPCQSHPLLGGVAQRALAGGGRSRLGAAAGAAQGAIARGAVGRDRA